MKRFMILVLTVLFICLTAAGCAHTPDIPAQQDNVTVRIGALKGPTSMGLVKLLDDAGNGMTENRYEYTMAAAADELTPKFLKGELDILAVPANLGSVLYNNSDGEVLVIAVNTLGVIYIVEKGGSQTESIADLKGQTIYATGKGTTPEYVLRYLLAQNGLDPDKDISVEWKSEPTEVIAQMSAEDHAVAMLPQPFVTVAAGQLDGLHIAVDMTEAWNALDNGSRCITATLIVRRAFADEHPEAVKNFLKEYKTSNDFTNNSPAEAAALIEQYGIVKAAVAEKAIPYCNLVCITGNDMKTALSGYLGILGTQNAKAIGGQLPADDYYLIYD